MEKDLLLREAEKDTIKKEGGPDIENCHYLKKYAENEKVSSTKHFLFSTLHIMAKFHQNRLTNKKVTVIAHFTVISVFLSKRKKRGMQIWKIAIISKNMPKWKKFPQQNIFYFRSYI